MVEIERLEVFAEPMELGETGIAERPVWQQTGEGREEVEVAASAPCVAVEEGRNHHCRRILADLLTILGSGTCLEFGQCVAETFKGLRRVAVVGIAHTLER